MVCVWRVLKVSSCGCALCVYECVHMCDECDKGVCVCVLGMCIGVCTCEECGTCVCVYMCDECGKGVCVVCMCVYV